MYIQYQTQDLPAELTDKIAESGVFDSGKHSVAYHTMFETPYIIDAHPDKLVQQMFSLKQELTGCDTIAANVALAFFLENREAKLVGRIATEITVEGEETNVR